MVDCGEQYIEMAQVRDCFVMARGQSPQHTRALMLAPPFAGCLPVQAQQRQVDAENGARRAAWRAACDAIAQRRTAAAEAKTAAERDLATARTQQAAERAQSAIAAAVVEAAEAQAQQVVELAGRKADVPRQR